MMNNPKRKLRFKTCPFEKARAFAHSLGLKKKNEWIAWTQTDARPSDIPAKPDRVYKDKGWQGWGDWLGTGRIANQNRIYLPFKEARAFIRKLGLRNQQEWIEWSKSDHKPDNIPSNPRYVYRNRGWVNMGDWLGTGHHKGNWRPFQGALEFTRSLQLKNKGLWGEWAKTGERPNDIPASPDITYQVEGWISWNDWLGTDNRRSGWLSYKEARAYVHSLSLNNKDDWAEWAKTSDRPQIIPASPAKVYKNKGWAGCGHWLGTNRVANQNRVYRSFKEARAFARSLGFKTYVEWKAWVTLNEKPDDIPASPSQTYGLEGWAGWGDWLGSITRWNRTATLGFLKSIEPILPNLQPVELYAILRQSGMLTAVATNSNTKIAPLLRSIRSLCSSPNPAADFDKLSGQLAVRNEIPIDDTGDDAETMPIVVPTEEEPREARDELPTLRSKPLTCS